MALKTSGIRPSVVCVGEHPLEPGVLLLKLLELLGLIDLHHAELLLPAMEGLLADLLLAADVQDRLVASFSLPQNADLLFGCGT